MAVGRCLRPEHSLKDSGRCTVCRCAYAVERLARSTSFALIKEHAKGMIRQSTACDMDEAFNRLRGHARNHNEGLTELASRLVSKSINSNDLDEWVKPTRV